METSFNLLLWRGVLADAASVPTGRDLAEWGEQLADAGEDAASALLLDVAAIHEGFSPQAIASRQGTAAADIAFDLPAASAGDWTLHRALDELRDLARRAASIGRPRLADPALPIRSGRPDNPAGIGSSTAVPVAGDIADTARDLRASLESAAVDGEQLRSLLASLVEAGRRCPALDYRAFAQSPLTLLVPAIAAVGLIDFALSTRDLWCPPLGDPALLHHVSRLDSAGLGPYLGNVGRLARSSGDAVEMARIARNAAAGQVKPSGGDMDGELAAWIAVLSRGCRGELLNEIVDDLGDLAVHGALTAILERVASRPAAAVDIGMVMRIRDAGLDNADHVLAARAQQVVVRLRPDDKLEGMILGSIEASGGEFGRAEAIYRHWLARFPNDLEVRERLLAVRTDLFDRFAIPYGYGSPADRRDTRLRRRGVSPDYQRRRGERIRAVDVG